MDSATAGPPPPRPRRGELSGTLEALIEDTTRERLSAGELLDIFGERSICILIFVFATPNCLPLGIPGTSAVLGWPLVVLTLQLTAGARRAWLPAWVRRRSFRHADFAAAMRRVLPWLRRLEDVLRPRLAWLTGRPGERLVGVIGVLLSLTILLPIPFGNALPAFTLAVLALGVVERDGVVVACGLVSAVLSALLTGAVLFAIASAGAWLVTP